MRHFSVIAAFLTCTTALSKPLELWEKLPANAQEFIIQGRKFHALNESGQTLDSYLVTRDGVHYVASVDKSRRIVYMTADAPFTTPEGVSSNSTFAQVAALT